MDRVFGQVLEEQVRENSLPGSTHFAAGDKNHVRHSVSGERFGRAGKRFQEGHTFLNFLGHIPTGLHVLSQRNIACVCREEFPQSLTGNPTTLTGKIELYKSRPGNCDFLASRDYQQVTQTGKYTTIVPKPVNLWG